MLGADREVATMGDVTGGVTEIGGVISPHPPDMEETSKALCYVSRHLHNTYPKEQVGM